MLLLILVSAASAQQCPGCSHEVSLGWRYCPAGGKDITGFKPKTDDDYLLGIAGPTEKVYQDVRSFRGIQTGSVRLYAARNETEAFQLALYAGSGPVELDLDKGIRITDLKTGESGPVLGAGAVTVLPIGYIPTKPPYYGEDHRGPQPDPLALSRAGDERLITVPKGEVRPVWVSIRVPGGTRPGSYSGTITVKPEGCKPKRIVLSLTVWDFSIPDKHHLPFAIDSISPASGYPRRPGETEKDWRKRLEAVQRALFISMLKHRITPLRSVGEPDFLSMEKGAPRFDYNLFDRRYNLYVRRLDQPVFAVGPEWPGWGSAKYGAWQPGKWIGFRGQKELVATYRSIGEHLSERGWHRGAFSYILDEKPGERTKEVTRLVHEGDPGMKNLCTIMVQEGYPDIDIWCPRMYELDRKRLELARKLQARGKEVWTYTSSPTPPFPAIVLDWDLINCRILPWMCWKLKLDGYLNWCVDWWKGDVWKDPNNFAGQNGNGFIYYPGEKDPIPSLRVKAIRDGLEDYEYFRMLGERLDEISRTGAGDRFAGITARAEKAMEIDDGIVKYFDDFTHDPGLLYSRREEMGRILDYISRAGKGAGKVRPKAPAKAGEKWKYSPFTGRPITVKDGGKKKAVKILWDFEDPRELSRWRLKHKIKAGLSKEHATSGKSSVRLDWQPGGGPSFRYEGRLADFSKWRYLKFDAFNPDKKDLSLNVKFKSSGHRKQSTLSFKIPPEESKTISIRLDGIAKKIDLSDVSYFNIFVWDPKEPGTVFIDNIRLTNE